MESRNVGSSGLRVSQVGLGCNNFGWTIDEEASRVVVHKALDCGVTLFDTADYYGTTPGDSETVLGNILKGQRESVILSTKFGVPAEGGHPNNSRSFILKAIEGSLRRLRTDRIDLYMIHWPDSTTAMEETLRALDDLVKAGKVRYIACSNLAPWRMVEAKWIAREASTHSFVAAQNEYSLLVRDAERDLIPALNAYRMGLIPYFPLASGLLTGKYQSDGEGGRLQSNFLKLGDRFMTEPNIAAVKRLDEYAKAHGRSLVELAMSWLADKPIISGIIAGATRPEQVEQNVRAVDWKLTAEDRVAIDKLLTG
jgi:aryl-alcohol dehydrogenase-like predicted oxidoreductase